MNADLTKKALSASDSNTEKDDENEKVDTPNNEVKKDKDSSTNNTSSQKEEYLKKFNDTKKEMDEKKPTDDTTYALKKVEGDRYDVWDGLLNEVYDVLKKQLPSEEMAKLRNEQREWIEYRDQSAKEASLKYKGGTMEQLEYVTVQNNLTEKRCFELVREYMK
ncbi:lysozyme inhibitor LprI family protein [Guptibacillus hwajinpoensis]|uniref:lysozyme inhibitor LprI family protein n=1 Tax=Guptibacillus hwajinpoensis TaxID=208199 RepID=UPI00384ACC7B